MDKPRYVVATKKQIGPDVIAIGLVKPYGDTHHWPGAGYPADATVYVRPDDARRLIYGSAVAVGLTTGLVTSLHLIDGRGHETEDAVMIDPTNTNDGLHNTDAFINAWPGWPIDPPPPIDGQPVEFEFDQLDIGKGLKRLRGED